MTEKNNWQPIVAMIVLCTVALIAAIKLATDNVVNAIERQTAIQSGR